MSCSSHAVRWRYIICEHFTSDVIHFILYLLLIIVLFNWHSIVAISKITNISKQLLKQHWNFQQMFWFKILEVPLRHSVTYDVSLFSCLYTISKIEFWVRMVMRYCCHVLTVFKITPN